MCLGWMDVACYAAFFRLRITSWKTSYTMSVLRQKSGILHSSAVMTFSPPHKTETAKAASASEFLILQPFSSTPQVSFEDVVPGTSVTKHVQIRNTSDIDHVVTIDKVPVASGFTADPTVFLVPAGGTQTVDFSWNPTSKAENCRCTVNVHSEEGYRGRIFLLGTVKKLLPIRAKVVKRTQPRTKVLLPSQKLNVKAEAHTQLLQKATAGTSMVTRIKEFTAAQPKTKKPEVKRNTTFKTNKPALATKPQAPFFPPVPKPANTEQTVTLPSSPNVRRETFTCIMPADMPTNSAATDEIERNQFEDSLEESRIETPIRNVTSTPPSTGEISKDVKEDEVKDTSSESYNELDFSGRMEQLYRKILEADFSTEDSKTATSNPNLLTDFLPALDHDDEASDPLAKDALQRPPDDPRGQVRDTPITSNRRLTFGTPGRSCAPGADPWASQADTESGASPPLPNILELIDKFNEGIDLSLLMHSNDPALMSMIDEYIPHENLNDGGAPSNFFPSDISSIHGTPACKTPAHHP